MAQECAMSLARNIDGCGVRRILVLTMGDVRYENSNEHARQRLSRHSVISNLEILLSRPRLLLRLWSAAGVQPTRLQHPPHRSGP